MNPKTSTVATKLPASFLCITLTVPYRSTKSITRFARFMAKFHRLQVPEGEYGSDVEGFKPILFDVGNDDDKMKIAIFQCQEIFKNNAVVLVKSTEWSWYRSRKGEMERRCPQWEYSSQYSYYGWEADNVILLQHAARDSDYLNYDMEMITRAKQRLAVILIWGRFNTPENVQHHLNNDHLYQAAKEGLIEVFDFSSATQETTWISWE